MLDLLEGLGYEGEPEFVPARPGELQRSVLDVSKAARLYGWRARDVAARRPVGHARVGHRRSYVAGRPPPRSLFVDVSFGGRTGPPSSTAAGPSSHHPAQRLRVHVQAVRRRLQPVLQQRAGARGRPSARPRRGSGRRRRPAAAAPCAGRPGRGRPGTSPRSAAPARRGPPGRACGRASAGWRPTRSGWARIDAVAADLQVAQDLGQLQRPARRRASPACSHSPPPPMLAMSSSWSLMAPRWSREISPPVRMSSGMSASVSASRRSPTPDHTRRASVG